LHRIALERSNNFGRIIMSCTTIVRKAVEYQKENGNLDKLFENLIDSCSNIFKELDKELVDANKNNMAEKIIIHCLKGHLYVNSGRSSMESDGEFGHAKNEYDYAWKLFKELVPGTSSPNNVIETFEDAKKGYDKIREEFYKSISDSYLLTNIIAASESIKEETYAEESGKYNKTHEILVDKINSTPSLEKIKEKMVQFEKVKMEYNNVQKKFK
jgi:hypothetical protein